MSETAVSREVVSETRAFESVGSLGDDLLIGAEAIARELNWKAADGRWNRRRVYHLADQGQVPIHRVKGLGICAQRSALREFFMALDAPYLERESG